ncbi:FHA domain-containing protein [Leptolyngbya sp. NIES-2104]|uniref:FHA domain-containing protein n=1 Tax=Leptolyngbya sp. NIES-2104 TaxID=1552121 RepID=UPI0006ECC928|nr:FHA domain-containing protein [Leptolyngbya sp. NIES-2104]GAP94465.1 FHA domain protein [Leptolyngbya sp. NIES-2104]
MYRLTLEWQEDNRNCSQTVSSQDQTKQGGTIRIGRDRERCDLVLHHPDRSIERTVSGLHIELFWNEAAQQIYLRNMTRDRIPPNPVVVDGQTVIDQELPIAENSKIKLGKMTLRVKLLQIDSQQTPQKEAVQAPRFVCKCTNPKGAHILPADYSLLTCHCGYQVLGATMIDYVIPQA